MEGPLRRLEAIRLALTARELVVGIVLFISDMVGEERIPVTLARLFAGKGGLAACIALDGSVAFESGKAHGGCVLSGLAAQCQGN
ncbi:hypothetical protein [Cupriavidus plantarum]|uniref:hypothetical protein n=1 Tax=Cupriavidus plantarum TaxID=942865 RepID=UPI00339D6437